MTTIPVTDAITSSASRRTTTARAVSGLAALLVGISSVPLLRAPWSPVLPGGVSVAHPSLVAWHVALEASLDCVLVVLLVAFTIWPDRYRDVAAPACALTGVVVLVNLPAAGPSILIISLLFLLPAFLAWQDGLSRRIIDAIGRSRPALLAAAIVAVPGLPYATLCLARQRTRGDEVAQAHAYASTAEHMVIAVLLLLLLSTVRPGTALLGWSLVAAGCYLAAAAMVCHGPAAPRLVGAAVAATSVLLIGAGLRRAHP